jgi:hypothetical protein
MLSFTVAGVLALTGIASATTKFTPALQKDATDSFVCRVANFGPERIQPVVKIVAGYGHAIKDETLQVGARQTASVTYTGAVLVGYCKVEGVYSRDRALVTFCVMPAGSTRCEASVGDPGL